MKWVLYLVSAILILSGSVFALQGMSLLPSRVMYSKPEWIWIGDAMVLLGGALIVIQTPKLKS